MQRILCFGIGLAAGVCGVTYALHLLNRSSDVAVGAGYLILLVIFGVAVEMIRHRRGKR